MNQFSTTKTHYCSDRLRWKSRQTLRWQHCLNRCQVSLGLRFSMANRQPARLQLTHRRCDINDNSQVTMEFDIVECKNWFHASHWLLSTVIKHQVSDCVLMDAFLSGVICIAALNPSGFCCLTAPLFHCVCVCVVLWSEMSWFKQTDWAADSLEWFYL